MQSGTLERRNAQGFKSACLKIKDSEWGRLKASDESIKSAATSHHDARYHARAQTGKKHFRAHTIIGGATGFGWLLAERKMMYAEQSPHITRHT